MILNGCLPDLDVGEAKIANDQEMRIFVAVCAGARNDLMKAPMCEFCSLFDK